MKITNYIPVVLIIILFNITCKKKEIETDPEEPYTFSISNDIILNVLPENGSSINIYDAPSVNFSLEINTILKNEKDVSYRAILDSFYVEDNASNKIPGNIEISEDKKSASFIPDNFFNIRESNYLGIYTHYEYLEDGIWIIYESDNLENNYLGYFSTDLNSPPSENVFILIHPENNTENISIYNDIVITCKYPIDSIISLYYSEMQHRLKFADFSISYENIGVNGNIHVSDKLISFVPSDTFPSNKTVNHSLKLYWEFYIDNQWTPFFQNNDTLFTEHIGIFSTENYIHTGVIDSANIEYSYPISRQYHFLKNESPTGYVKLRFQQDDIFESKSWSFIARYTSPGLETIDVNINYNEQNLLFSFPIPSSQLENETIYKLTFIQVFKKTKEENPFHELYFRTSMYNTFETKFNAIVSNGFGYGSMWVSGFRLLNLSYFGEESFDKYENSYITKLEAMTNNSWYEDYIYPLIYEDLSTSGLYLNRTAQPLGIPPVKCFSLSKYNSGSTIIILTDDQINNNNAPRINLSTGYINYLLDYYMRIDYNDLYSQIQEIPVEERTEWMTNLINSSYPSMLAGYPSYIYYDVKLKYMITPEITTYETIIQFGY